jgi:methionyl-tRNA formyltransferase
MGAEMICAALDDLPALVPVPQPEDGVTYAAKIDKSEARIEWSLPAARIARQINALSPFPGAWCMGPEGRLKLLRAVAAGGNGTPGTVLDAPGLRIACGEGRLMCWMPSAKASGPCPWPSCSKV